MSPTSDLGPNQTLIGRPGSRHRLATPALIVELGALERNIAKMARDHAAIGLDLRPHAKTHKSAAIARKQIDAGALGVCCATLREAEAMAAGDIPGVHLSSPVVGDGKLRRLAALNAEAEGLMVVADNQQNLAQLGEAAEASGKSLNVLVDIDVGMARTGVGTVEGAVRLARAVSDAEYLTYRGIQGYSGRVQHIERLGERTEVYGAHLDHLRDVVEALGDAGLAPEIVSGGGTGTHGIDREAGLFTEHQAGSYIFMDVEYNAVEFDGTGEPPFETALFVQCSVVSNNAEGFVTIDGGFKCFATDGPKPRIAATSIEGAGFDRFGDEHGKVILPEGANEKPGLGDPILLITPHCDPTVNLHDYYHVVDGDTLVDIWPVDARGVL